MSALGARIWAVAGPTVGNAYIDRIEQFCQTLRFASERGSRRDDVLPGLRILGFERSMTIAFTVSSEQVTILRCFYRGRNWERELQ